MTTGLVPKVSRRQASLRHRVVAWMRQEARLIPHPTIRVLNGVGHGVLRSPAGIRALRSFLESGSGP